MNQNLTPPEDLEFQDSSLHEPTGRMNLDDNILDVQPLNPTTPNSIPNSPTILLDDNEEDEDELKDLDLSQYNFWNIEYYMPYFNINTTEVALRLSKPFLFLFQTNQPFISFIRRGKKQSDLWGPFWVITSLIVVIVMTSNLSELININSIGRKIKDDLTPKSLFNTNNTNDNNKINDSSILEWTLDFSVISVGSTLFYVYSIVVPAMLWFMMKYKGIMINLIETICVYGYSFIVILPCLLLCIFDITWLRWLLILLGFIYSSLFIIFSLLPEWKKVVNGPQDNLFLLIFVLFVFILHVLLACFVKLYFYTFSVSLPK
ncbi:hypothetical protein ABK040_006423 [Willaertia magna]